jgi:NAD(P)H-dependent FMN reductase
MTKIHIVLGSTRPNRNGRAVAEWVYGIAKKRDDFEARLLDVADFELPWPSFGSPMSESSWRCRS